MEESSCNLSSTRTLYRSADSNFSFHCVLAIIVVDNAAMIGWASMYRFLEGQTDDYSIEPRSKWSIEDLGGDFT